MNTTKTHAPYGSWPSDISSNDLTQNTVRLCEPQLDQGHCYWLEQRPEEQGRCVVVCQQMNGSQKAARFDVSPANISVRTKAHEYGGASYLVHNNVLYYVNAADQRVYSVSVDPSHTAEPLALSPENSEQVNYCYADFHIDEKRQQLIAVCEIHREQNEQHPEPESNVVSLRLDGLSTIGFNILVFGNDFYSNPSVSPDGDKLLWLTWNHPNMPWDSSECWIADFTSLGMLQKHRKVAGGYRGVEATSKEGIAEQQALPKTDRGESVFQPQWSPTGEVIFASDRTNWWNLYSYDTYNKYTEILADMPAEFATPQWVFGMSTYSFLNSYTLICTYTQQGQWYLATIDLMSRTFTPCDIPFTHIDAIAAQNDDDTALFIAASETSLPVIVRWKKDQWDIIAASSENALSEHNLSIPQAIDFTNSSEQTVHGFFYAPSNHHYEDTSGNQPPLLVMCHGGPTGATSASLNIKIQYWTNRGFAVFDINYSGSTGYGREYRRRLYQQWGILDVDDLCAGAQYLIDNGDVNAEQIAIRGSSAGGYSVLAALTFRDTFKAGASLYGIGDLSLLAEDTHKFESRYCDQLIGDYVKDKARYLERSPLHHIEQLNCPVIFLQGLQDKVVPPNQAEMMVAALHQKHIPVAHVTYPQEGHGFRQADNIRHAIEVEYGFYAHIFGFTPAETLPTVPFLEANTASPKSSL